MKLYCKKFRADIDIKLIFGYFKNEIYCPIV